MSQFTKDVSASAGWFTRIEKALFTNFARHVADLSKYLMNFPQAHLAVYCCILLLLFNMNAFIFYDYILFATVMKALLVQYLGTLSPYID
jgi:hypothetical protein